MHSMKPRLNIQTIVSAPFEENTYLAWLPERSDVVIIDPGLEPDLILEFLDEQGLEVVAILNTHGHGDHIGGNEAMKARYPKAPIIIGANEAHMLTDPMANVSGLFGMPIVSPPADQIVAEGDIIHVAGIELEVREIPGHSGGHVVFVYFGAPVVVFGGDVLFRGSVGRSDFPGGSFERLASGIRTKLYSLPPDTVVYPGHGPVTTVGHERTTNPFVRQEAPG
jgi:glyoxylase-like metal-dependent hydrolase (beta-lactamase superfamily II)